MTGFGYDAVGNQTTLTDALSRVTRTWYDALDRPITVVANFEDGVFDPSAPDEDLTTLSVYDAVGNLTQITDPQSQITVHAYDALDRLVATTDALGDTEAREYDGVGNLTAIRDPKSAITQYEYDALDRLVRISDPLGATTAYVYDRVGNIVTETDANGHAFTYGYDRLYRVISVTDHLGNQTLFTLRVAHVLQVARPPAQGRVPGGASAVRLWLSCRWTSFPPVIPSFGGIRPVAA